MPPTLRDSPERDAYLDLLRAHERLLGAFEALFRAHGLTHTQFNVLRILVTEDGESLPCQAIGERLVHRVPDVTRLLDRMERAGLVTRSRSTTDRRVVLVHLTDEGRRRCEDLYPAVEELHRELLAHLDPEELTALRRGLAAVLRGA